MFMLPDYKMKWTEIWREGWTAEMRVLMGTHKLGETDGQTGLVKKSGERWRRTNIHKNKGKDRG